MPEEIEAKFRVASAGEHRRLAKRLRRLGAEFLRAVVETDTFFDTPDGRMLKSDSTVRLRRTAVRRSPPGRRLIVPALLTYKGPRQSAGAVKKRLEIQTHVDDAEAMSAVLRAAGLAEVMTLQKRRSSYRLGRCRFELDELPLIGRFVEIEGPSGRAVEQARKKLDLPDEPITDSYSHMVLAEMKHCKQSPADRVRVLLPRRQQ